MVLRGLSYYEVMGLKLAMKLLLSKISMQTHTYLYKMVNISFLLHQIRVTKHEAIPHSIVHYAIYD